MESEGVADEVDGISSKTEFGEDIFHGDFGEVWDTLLGLWVLWIIALDEVEESSCFVLFEKAHQVGCQCFFVRCRNFGDL